MERHELIKKIRSELDNHSVFKDVAMSREMDDVKKELLIQIVLDCMADNKVWEESIGSVAIEIGGDVCYAHFKSVEETYKFSGYLSGLRERIK